MPLLCIKDSLPDVRLALWHLEETAEELLERYDVGKDFSEQVFLNNKSAHRRAEIIVVRLLIDCLFSRDVVLNHDKSGRPLLSNGYFISISHTSNIVAVIVSNIFEVSVDVEHISNRVVRVADRFMRLDEKANETIEYLLHWCVKETLYKLYSEDDLSFEEMRINHIHYKDDEGEVVAENLRRMESVCLPYFVLENCVLTYAIKTRK